MSASCFYHPERATDKSCAQCGIPLCSECGQIVAEKPVCSNCVSAIRSRIAREQSTVPSAGVAAGAAVAPPPIAPVASRGYAATEPASSSGKSAPVRATLGILYGLAIGIVGAIAWEKFVFYTHFNIGYLTALIGFGVGFGVIMGYRRGGLVPAIMGAVIAFVAQMFGYGLLFHDMILADAGNSIPADFILTPHMFMDIAQNGGISGMDWIIIAIGVYGGFKTPYRAAV